MHVSYNLDKNVQRNVLNYTVSQQNSEPQNLQQHASVLHTAFRNHITLKTLLNSDAKRKRINKFHKFSSGKAYIYIYIYMSTELRARKLLFAIIRNKRNY